MNRLTTIANMIAPGDRVGDVGTDHAYLAIHLIKNNIARRVIASDVNRGPLAMAQRHLAEQQLSDKIELRLGSGLTPYRKGEVDCFVIAGMGGHLIGEIISCQILTARAVDYMVLQPMQHRAALRSFLYSNSFVILEERVAVEGDKYYQIFKVKPGLAQLSWQQKEIGVNPHIDDNYRAYLADKLTRYHTILQAVLNSDDAEKIKQLEAYIAMLEEAINHANQR